MSLHLIFFFKKKNYLSLSFSLICNFSCHIFSSSLSFLFYHFIKFCFFMVVVGRGISFLRLLIKLFATSFTSAEIEGSLLESDGLKEPGSKKR